MLPREDIYICNWKFPDGSDRVFAPRRVVFGETDARSRDRVSLWDRLLACDGIILRCTRKSRYRDMRDPRANYICVSLLLVMSEAPKS
jgi:hypothetical protein